MRTGFSEFFESISAPSLKAIAAHWQEVRGSKRIPSFGDLQPRALKSHLPIIWSYKYDRASRSFTGRLAGDRIALLFGKNFRGLPLVEAHGPDAISTIYAGLSRIILEPAAHRGWGKVLKHQDQFGMGERIMLPLANDGVNGDEVLGATEYLLPQIIPGVPVQSISEEEAWFIL